MNTSQEIEPISNIVTAPDFVDNSNLKVLLFDISAQDLLQAEMVISSAPIGVDLYVYGSQSSETGWLDRVSSKMDLIVLGFGDSHRLVRQALTQSCRTAHLGPTGSVVEHLVRLINERKGSE